MSEHLREMWREAATNSDLIARLEFIDTSDSADQVRTLTALLDGKAVGQIQVFGRYYSAKARGRVKWIATAEQYERQGIATALWTEAQCRWSDLTLKHSEDRTNDGDAWARAVGGEMPRRLSALSGIKTESPTPLDYRGKFWGKSTRFYITDDAAGEPGRWDTYFKNSSGGDGFTAPTDPDTVAWLDVFEDNGPGRQWVYIAFIAVRDAYRGQGLGSRLIAHLYATYPQARIEWGTLVGDRTPKMYQKYKRTHPDQTGSGTPW